MAEHGRYRGTAALDVAVPGAVPPLRLLALDARDRGFTLRGTTAPARTPDGTVGRAPMPFWVAEADTGSRHETTSGGSGGHDDGSTTWSADLQPALAEGVRSVRLTEVLSPLRLESGATTKGLAGPVALDLSAWPPHLRTAPATVAPDELVVRSPLAGHHAGLQGTMGSGRPDRVMPVSTRLDTGRSNDPAVMSIEAWPGWFELHLTWGAYVTIGHVIGTGWPARDDRGHHYHGVAHHGDGGSGTRLGLVFAPALAPAARTLRLTLPDMVSTPVTGAGALHATVDLRPDVG